MNKSRLISMLVLLVLAGFQLKIQAETPFPYEQWSNKEGKSFDARLDRIKPDGSVVLQAKEGGRRYTIKRTTLTEASNQVIDKLVEDSKKVLLEAKSIDGAEIYKAIALGLTKDAEAALKGKTTSVDVIGIRISTDKLTAYLELEGALFAKLSLSGKSEFFEKNKALYVRSSVKGNYWWSRMDGRSNVDVDSQLVIREGEKWTFRFSPEVKLEWGQIGVVEGAIITD